MTKRKEKQLRCGIVSIVGRPNTGKSTLMNRIVGEKVAIVSKIPQTTRNRIRGIYNDERGQIVFIDTPGLHLGKDKLDELLVKSSFGTLQDVDCVIHLVDARESTGSEEKAIVDRLKTLKVPVILGLNKADYKPKHLPQYIKLWEAAKGRPVTELTEELVLLPLSGKSGTNIDKLVDIIFEHLPESPPLYPRDAVTDIPQKMAIADVIREKLLQSMREEVPHALTVAVENITPRRKNVWHIDALILVDRESQKEIVIGRRGRNLKRIGTRARKELEDLLQRKVYLDLFVKHKRRWRNDEALLQELGYDPYES